MIGLDTNILIRFLTHDDPRLTPVAIDIVENRLTEDEPGFISLVVLAETSWVLRRIYGYRVQQIGGALRVLAQLPMIRMESEQEAFAAIDAAEKNGVDLADVLIAGLGRKAGCAVTLTFDSDASRLPGFQLAR